jgi:hypothetical protein
MAAADSKVKSVSSSAPISSRPTMFESHPGRETVSSIIETDDRVNNPVAGSSPAGGAKIESNGVSFCLHQAVSRFRLENYPISGIDKDLQIFRAS